eukprot:3550344-Amphidinium_carterae.1
MIAAVVCLCWACVAGRGRSDVHADVKDLRAWSLQFSSSPLRSSTWYCHAHSHWLGHCELLDTAGQGCHACA